MRRHVGLWGPLYLVGGWLSLCVVMMLAGCGVLGHGIPDADTTFKPAKDHPCERYIIVQPDHVARCMTREEFDRWVRQNLPQRR